MEQAHEGNDAVALVTGAGQRLGRVIALALARDGWDVVVHYRGSEAAATSTADEVRKLGRRAALVQADLDDESSVLGLLGRCAEVLGEVRCVVNSAARFDYDDAASFSGANLIGQMRTNTVAPVLLARELKTRVQSQPAGRPAVVINLLDQKLSNPNPDFFSYTLSKAALQTATVLLAQALAPWVRVVGVAPGITLPSPGQSDASFARAQASTPLGHGSSPDDIGEAVCYLARAHAVTGVMLLVDGGQHLAPSARDIMFQSE